MAENNKTMQPDETAERLVRQERNRKLCRFFQWIAALAFLGMAAACFSKDLYGTLGGAMMLVAGWLVSPMVDEMDLLEKLPERSRLIIQIAAAATLFAGGYLISKQSPENADDPPEAQTSAAVVSVEE